MHSKTTNTKLLTYALIAAVIFTAFVAIFHMDWVIAGPPKSTKKDHQNNSHFSQVSYTAER